VLASTQLLFIGRRGVVIRPAPRFQTAPPTVP
jgi:hypothetical protein